MYDEALVGKKITKGFEKGSFKIKSESFLWTTILVAVWNWNLANY